MAQAKTLLGQNWVGHLDCRDPVILLGDFNARRRSVVYRRFTATLRDAQLVLHKRARRTFPRACRCCALIIFSAADGRRAARRGAAKPSSSAAASDHLPLVMDFRIVEHERSRVSQRPMMGYASSWWFIAHISRKVAAGHPRDLHPPCGCHVISVVSRLCAASRRFVSQCVHAVEMATCHRLRPTDYQDRGSGFARV